MSEADEIFDQERNDAIELARRNEIEELRLILQSKGGRALLWRLIGKCGLYQATPLGDAIFLAAAVEKMNYGKWLLAECFTADPNAYTLMAIESAERESRIPKPKQQSGE